MDPLDALVALGDKVDAFVARVEARHRDELRCAPGCDGCCRVRLTVTGVEATRLARHVAALPAAARAALAATVARPVDPADVRCAALDDAGRCAVYEARPLVCRSHGVPIRLRGPDGAPRIEACALNFVEAGPAAAAPECVLDQQTLSATLLTIDRLAGGGGLASGGARRDLATVLRDALDAAG